MIKNTKSKLSLTLNSPLSTLVKGPLPAYIKGLEKAGISSTQDLLWVLPLRAQTLPNTQPFTSLKPEQYFKGRGQIVSYQEKPSFIRKHPKLYNLDLIIQDHLSPLTLKLKWFNAYPNQRIKLKALNTIEFLGVPQQYLGQYQIVNPLLGDQIPPAGQKLVDYPTVNKVSGKRILGLIQKIPDYFWEQAEEILPASLLKKNQLPGLKQAFQILHGIASPFSTEQARFRLIYQEFFEEQLKILIRQQKRQSYSKKSWELTKNELIPLIKKFPYTLTPDQEKVLDDVIQDLNQSFPMMRLIQGDVGSGKTTVAFLVALAAIKRKKQVAFMCPTESLAFQHFQTFQNLFRDQELKVELLTGSIRESHKKKLKGQLEKGHIDFIIGTHALFQESVSFWNLGLAIIDEQHKFGVQQRLKLSQKNNALDVLTMTATPIPRSLSLTAYGDLDISTIKQMPGGRKPIQSRIVQPHLFEQFLRFLKTRLSLNEQAYIVVPAIEDNPDQDFQNLEKVFARFQQYFPDEKLAPLHGKLSAAEKQKTFQRFLQGHINILVATSVIEVGINNINATVMAILSPERFGLSSLHQLRGRIGRGCKPGFFFMITDKTLGPDSAERLKIIEQNLDGFKIAEEDLKLRGEGNLFGVDQSGLGAYRKIANLNQHQDILFKVRHDLEELFQQKDPQLQTLIENFSQDRLLHLTI